ncbi:disease resistance protein PIK6-NP-like isoform X2 [Hordeum vulgare subsp. vulgare]|uniref:RGH1 n=1 Tax=Hordeum vulgare subsp. vulgare TaxID=112509 RepID=M0YHN2_HORVV|nr:disease resistance protein PIK6-NP-like isoform X2 [Hordeum vulgare subsp. vulgare]XP_044956472.1 disease resistance protein PIK6-NP-like isoform X2 [Hordeum vulgare subsp. vulgare]XP_044956473.1 disease resistance protein PIK6-NP-like isoform X2 [Hordeum vulgare subsp. vulgare]XP_044956475.1 disease resistance protein PIK6-NP-like isoform X2 [Hordeum vulgare subsp. vulgare]XP_044956476.1 disease resistance protein PIK6-NP-like isoform X2 [Hordeum vulgare subsp. vulgare]
MDLATAAMHSLLPKLFELLHGEYKLHKALKKDVEFLEREMRSIDAALRKVAMVPRDKLDDNSKIWANQVRELSYEMEDLVESFLVGVQGVDPAANPHGFRGFVRKVANLFTKGKARHQIADAIKAVKDQVQQVADRRDRYKIDDVEASLAATTMVEPVDPRLMVQFKDHRELVGIEEPRDELIKRLADEDDCVSKAKQQLKILSIFGFGGLGKTTLAKAVYDKIQAEFECKAFYSVGQNPNLKNVLLGILLRIDKASCHNVTLLDEVLLIEKLRELLTNKRYLIIIDDIWDMSSWHIIKCAFTDSQCGSRVITTTRIFEVAKEAGDIYKQEPLSPGRSKELFCMRLSIGKRKSTYHESVKISEKILQKCGGIPLAIITIASLLASKPVTDWPGVYDSIGFGNEDNKEVDTTRKILLYSYYDLPYYPRLCLLHLGIYPEDFEIKKDTLIWKWVAEGYVHEEPGKGLFEVGERYFNMLIDRSMIQAVERPYYSIIYACRVHDLVLDMIHFLSEDESFVTASNSNRTSPRTTARRLAINNEVVEQDGFVANASMQQVRLYSATMCHFSVFPLLSNFKALRVLALEECTFMGSERSLKPEDSPYHLNHLGRLIHLRYLGISDRLVGFFVPGVSVSLILEVPEEIGDLRFLQVLDLGRTGIKKLPQSVGRLTQLKCLRFGGSSVEVLDCTNLTSLEELQLHLVSPHFLKGLAKLKELRKISLHFEEEHDNMLFKDLMGHIANLQKLKVIMFNCMRRPHPKPWSNYAGSVALGHLRHLTVNGLLPGLPVWINSSCLPNLCHLHMELTAMKSQDIEILGRFSELITLTILLDDYMVFPNAMEEGAFPKLRYLELKNSNQPRFVQGAMSNLECFRLIISLVETNGWDFHCLVNLPRLEKVDAEILGNTGMGINELQAHEWLKQAHASLKHAVDIHPNHPALKLQIYHS